MANERETTPSLRGLQSQFQSYVTDGAEDFTAQVRDTSKAKREKLLAVYRDAYWLRLVECLTTDFPGLRALLGAAAFQNLARAYLRAHPPRHANVRWFGQSLPAFAAAHLPPAQRLSAQEMAQFEWALGEAHDGADAPCVSFEQLAALPGEAWSSLRLSFHPAMHRLCLRSNAPSAWLEREAFVDGGLVVTEGERPTAWLIWRQNGEQALEVQFRSLADDEALLLDLAAAGETFPALCAALEKSLPEDQAAARAAGLLRAWIEAGLIAGFSADP